MEKKRIDTTLIALIVIVLLGYILMHDIFGGTLFAHNSWDSYTLQALAWRDGRLDLGQNYSYLEIAVFEGKYYVSFPPTPTLVMLPLTFIFGNNTPNNIVVMLYAIITAIVVYKVLLMVNFKNISAACLSSLIVFGSNALWMSTVGGVWFQAQLLNMLLLWLAIYFSLKDKRAAAYAMVALAVGCRPFSLFVFPVLFVFFLMRDLKDKPKKDFRSILLTSLSQLKCLIIPAIIGAGYMALNYARFGSVFEFGHNYLPEFLNDPQFGLHYIPQNLKNLLLTFVGFDGNGQLTFPIFNGFFLFIANPIFIITFAAFIRDIVKKRVDITMIVSTVCVIGILIATCAHKTLGGWQFGARYTVDMIPLACFTYLLGRKKELFENMPIPAPECVDGPTSLIQKKQFTLNAAEAVICAFGIMFNVYGAIVINLGLK